MKKWIIAFIFLSLLGCKGKFEAPKGYVVYAVQRRPIVNELFFSGTVQALKLAVMISPVDGVIEKKYFEYGQQLKVGMPLFTLRSAQLEKDYRESLTSYLKAKEQYDNNQTKLDEDEVLHKEGIISTNEYHASQTNYNDAYLSYFQAEQSLSQILQKANIKLEEAKSLMISDREAVNKALLTQFDILNLNANADGVALLPEKGAGTGEEGAGSSTKVVVGSQVKAGQVLVSIGDMTGISLTVSVNQVDINSIKVGQKAVVTSDGFPGIVLEGEVADVSAQALAGVGSVLPTFPVRVDVKHISEDDRKKIAVGMSAMVKIIVAHEPTILVPINAVMVKNGLSTIKMFDRETNKKIIEVPVMTGQTTLQDVEVTKGLIAGDHILVHRKT
ncbi:MAG: HlyD family efflux transporter periplasmic adaptor subunit [Gammaproteobacteria bacterium]|nr:HlyD family efflux transporter periplasmic adaptor subunit [Gammaproteobacteria bacterium]